MELETISYNWTFSDFFLHTFSLKLLHLKVFFCMMRTFSYLPFLKNSLCIYNLYNSEKNPINCLNGLLRGDQPTNLIFNVIKLRYFIFFSFLQTTGSRTYLTGYPAHNKSIISVLLIQGFSYFYTPHFIKHI